MTKLRNYLMVLGCLFSCSALHAETIKMSQQQLISILNAPAAADYVVLDVRTPEEFAQGHIEGAINLSHDLVADNLAQLMPYKDKTLIVHCRSGKRAALAEAILIENGFTKLKHLDGDMKAWQKSGLPLVSAH